MILYIAKRSQYDIGAKTHLEALKEIFGEDQVFVVDLFKSEAERGERYIAFGRYRNYFDRIKRSFEGNTVFLSNREIQEICGLLKSKRIGLVFSEESDLGNLMRAIKQMAPQTRIICFYHDITADLFAQRRKHASWKDLYFKLIESNITIRQEKISQKYVDEHWVYNQCDSDRYNRIYHANPTGIIPLCTYPPAMAATDFELITGREEPKKILFVCSSYYVNIEGFLWFYRTVYAKLNGKFSLKVVGNGSDSIMERLHDKNIEFVGHVDSLEPYYREADIVITPIFDGGGMKVKSLEAVSYAKHILGTGESLHGFWENAPESIRNSVMFCSNKAEEWINILNRLLHSDISKHDKDAFNWFMQHYTYDVMIGQFRRMGLIKWKKY